MTELERDTIQFPDGDEGRVYWNPDENPPVPFASVTTITGRRDDPGKDRALRFWEQKFSGENGKADSDLILWWTRNRGTLVHWHILSSLVDLPITYDEKSSMADIRAHSDDYEYVYSALGYRTGEASDFGFPCDTEYYRQLATAENPEDEPVTLERLVFRDMEWCLSNFAELAPQMGLADGPFSESDHRYLHEWYDDQIRSENIINAEEYVRNMAFQYGGQYDLLYEKTNGDVTLADLKTSSSIRWTHKAQGVAYSQAIDRDVDVLEVVQLHPDKSQAHVSRDNSWSESRDELWREFRYINETEVLPLVENIDLEAHLDDADTDAPASA